MSITAAAAAHERLGTTSLPHQPSSSAFYWLLSAAASWECPWSWKYFLGDSQKPTRAIPECLYRSSEGSWGAGQMASLKFRASFPRMGRCCLGSFGNAPMPSQRSGAFHEFVSDALVSVEKKKNRFVLCTIRPGIPVSCVKDVAVLNSQFWPGIK